MHENNTWIEANESDTTIVFIHGILSNSETCWRNPDNGAYWPSLVLEDKQFKRPSVFVSGYTADRRSGEFEVFDAAEEVMIYLQSEIDGHIPLSKEKLLFICHSQGGLVARRMLCSHAREFHDKKVGIVLCASPSLGSNWARWFRPLCQICGNAQGEGLDPRDPRLLDLDRDFRRLLDEKTIPDFCGLSLVETSGVWFRLSKIVSTESASRDFIWRKIPKSTHGQVVKPDNERHLSHVYVRRFALKEGFISVNRVERAQANPRGDTAPNKDTTRSSGEQLTTIQLALRKVPEADFAEELDSKFVGRANLREDVSGLMNRLQQGKGGVYWVHGFGGMGKSFFLRRIYLDVPDNVKKALVDFDDRSDRFRAPLKDKPRTEADLFDAIACAFARILDADAFQTYWRASTEIRRRETYRAELERRFDATVERLVLILAKQRPDDFPQPVINVPDRFPTAEEHAKNHECECLLALVADPTVRRALAQMRPIRRARLEFFDYASWEGMLSRWIMGIETAPDNAIKDPGGFLSQNLCQSLVSFLRESASVLILDTLEVLSERLDHHLCQFLTSVIHGGSRLLAVTGSRWRPDDRRRPESFTGWHQGLRDKLRTVPFEDDVKFRQSDVQELLLRLHRRPPNEEDLPAKLVAYTLGVPMSVGSVLRLHEEGDDILSRLAELTPPDAGLIRSKATSLVIAETARRFLLHIEIRQQDDDALRDVILLTLVEGPWSDKLQEAWWGGANRRRERLAQLTTQVDFMDGWSIRPEPARYFRQHWSNDPHRLLPEVIQRAVQLMEKEKDLAARKPETLYGWLRTFASVLLWIDAARALNARLEAAVISRAHPSISMLEEHWENEQSIGWEEALTSNAAQDWLRLKAVERPSFQWGENLSDDVLTFLENAIVTDWPPIALASWHQVLGVALGQDSDEKSEKERKDRAKRSMHHLREAMRILGQVQKDKDELVEAYLNAIVRLTVNQDEPKDANEGIEWLLSQDLLNTPKAGNRWRNYGLLLHNVKRYAESNEAYRKAMSLDPTLWRVLALIAHNYFHENQFSDERSVLETAVREHPEYVPFWEALANSYFDRPATETEKTSFVRRALKRLRWDGKGLTHCGKFLFLNGRKYKSAIAVLKRALRCFREDDAEKREAAFWLILAAQASGDADEALAGEKELLDSQLTALELNHFGWEIFLHGPVPGFGLECIDRALKMEPASHFFLNTRLALLCRMEKWNDAADALARWMSHAPVGELKEAWSAHVHLFRLVQRMERGGWVASLIRENQGDSDFLILADILERGGDLSKIWRIATPAPPTAESIGS